MSTRPIAAMGMCHMCQQPRSLTAESTCAVCGDGFIEIIDNWRDEESGNEDEEIPEEDEDIQDHFFMPFPFGMGSNSAGRTNRNSHSETRTGNSNIERNPNPPSNNAINGSSDTNRLRNLPFGQAPGSNPVQHASDLIANLTQSYSQTQGLPRRQVFVSSGQWDVDPVTHEMTSVEMPQDGENSSSQGFGGVTNILEFMMGAGANRNQDMLMGLIQDMLGGGLGGGVSGDYVVGQRAMDQVMNRLMEQTRHDNLHPASAEQIETLQIISPQEIKPPIEADAECSICKDLILTEDKEKKVAKLPRCGHVFDSECIIAWLRVNGVCPVCRKGLAESLDPPLSPATPSSAAATTSAPTYARPGS